MSHGWTKTAAPSPLAASKTGKSTGSSRFHSLTCVPIWTPAQAELAHAALELADRQLGVLQRQRAQPDEAARVVADDAGDVIVEQPRQVERVLGLAPSS